MKDVGHPVPPQVCKYSQGNTAATFQLMELYKSSGSKISMTLMELYKSGGSKISMALPIRPIPTPYTYINPHFYKVKFH